MTQEVMNFARFYASFNRLPCTGDKETTKQEIVMQWTGNRTGSLREMTRKAVSYTHLTLPTILLV